MKKGVAIILIFLGLVLVLFFIRLFSHTEIDDVTPEIPCEGEYLMKSDVLWVIPDYQGVPISSNKTWCDYILSLNKTIGMHGITHEFEEFGKDRNQEYLDEGVKIFEDCFGFRPTMFKPPQLKISNANKLLIENNGMELKDRFNQITHKVYHCNDTGDFSNWVVGAF